METKLLYVKICRSFVLIALSVAFIGMIVKCIIRVNLEETTFVSKEVEGAYFPTFTICPDMKEEEFIPGKNKSFEDLNEAIEKTKQCYSATLSIASNNGHIKTYDLKNQELNSSTNEVWSFVVGPDFNPFLYLKVCAKIVIPSFEIDKGQFTYFEVRIKDHEAKYYTIVTSDPKESKYSIQTDWGKNIDVSMEHSFFSRKLKMLTTKRLATNSYKCEENNEIFFESCINNFIVDFLSCCPIWAKDCNDDLEPCSGIEKLEQFMNLSKILSEDLTDVKKCFEPKCVTNDWITISELDFTNTLVSSYGNNITAFEYVIPSNSMIEERTETLLYNYVNLIADFGGYLGLFLGGSMLSLFDLLFSSIHRSFHVNVAQY